MVKDHVYDINGSIENIDEQTISNDEIIQLFFFFRVFLFFYFTHYFDR